MKLIVGLGNPGKKYEKTRHNVGFMVLDKLAKNPWKKNKNGLLLYSWLGSEIEFIKPQTFMNKSGDAVAYAAKKHGLSGDEIIVVYDDIDLPLGKIRVRGEGSSGGHKGVESIIGAIGNNFSRIRVGIARLDSTESKRGQENIKIPAEDFVLQNFTADEEKIIKKSIKETAEAVEFASNNDIKEVMNKYN